MLTPLTPHRRSRCCRVAPCWRSRRAATATTQRDRRRPDAIRPESYAPEAAGDAAIDGPGRPRARDADGRSAPSRATRCTRTSTPSRSPHCSTSTLDALRNFNGWDDGLLGASRRPEARSASRRAPSSSTRPPRRRPSTADGRRTTDDEGTTRAPPRPATLRRHVPAEEGDYPVDVAQKFDVTVEAAARRQRLRHGRRWQRRYTGRRRIEIQLPAGLLHGDDDDRSPPG